MASASVTDQLDVGAFIKGTRLIRFMQSMYMKRVPINGVRLFPLGPSMPHTNESNPPASISNADCSLPGIILRRRDAIIVIREMIVITITENIMLS